MSDFSDISKALNIDYALKSASELSTFSGGGMAYTLMPKTLLQATKAIAFLTKENIHFHILGGGSNLLISDGICKNILVDFKALNNVEINGDFITCQAGASLAKIIHVARVHSLCGLEFLSGVPCTFGGAIKMNASAFSSQIADYIHSIDILSCDIANCDKICNTQPQENLSTYFKRIYPQSQDFSYRRGIDGIVLNATLKLAKCDKKKSLELSKKYLAYRKHTQPNFPSIGCTFKNGKISSGKLIDECGLKGYKIGGAMISKTHANFIVNVQNATASDYLALVDLAKESVLKNFGISLEEEFKLVK